MVNLTEFCEFLSIPSISSEPEYAKEVRRCALWLQQKINVLGFHTELWETPGHPTLFAERIIDPALPTLLIYNHYDVQPVDPLELWTTPPFEPIIKDGCVYARGAQDNKGQCFYVLEAIRKLHESKQFPPINVKLIIEGEEECGSAHLPELLKQKKQELKADYVAVVDLGIPTPDTPAITLGTRGLVTFDITFTGSTVDLHSGSHGGIAFNPLHALVKLLGEVRDNEGHILIPGFYDDIVELSSEEKKRLAFTFDPAQYKKHFGIIPTGGESAFQPLERLWVRPTLEINGISGGYTGEGFKTVIPSKAKVKLSSRLVPNQSPDRITALIKDYFETHAPPGIEVHVKPHSGRGQAARSNSGSKGVQAFAKAFSEVFQKPCQYTFEGASIPIIPELVEASGAEPILLGLGLTTDCIHAPNEHFGIDRLEKGVEIISKAIQLLASITHSK